jgi:hypothetical protein
MPRVIGIPVRGFQVHRELDPLVAGLHS